LLVLVTGALALRRFVASQISQRLERQNVDRELEQARELQQHVLTPEVIQSSLFTVETAYHPARTVGGDFFQAISHQDGSLLIVVGDVSGKGIAAAMLVAVLVGAIRTRADETFDPAAILDTLNDRLLGRAGGHFATCMVAHLRPGGTMLIANAGHLPPYRNGIPIDLPGSLPLGILSDVGYDVHTIQLDPADHLTFLTDGVLEARNSAGQLLGFEQTAQLSSLPPDVIARAAIHHGQEDDITIVSVRLRTVTHAVESAPLLEVSPIHGSRSD
jgi:serine phosphatase RsbU (regulator of sigma subunit)